MSGTVTLSRDGIRHRLIFPVKTVVRETRCGLRVVLTASCDPSSAYQRATRRDCGPGTPCGKCEHPGGER